MYFQHVPLKFVIKKVGVEVLDSRCAKNVQVVYIVLNLHTEVVKLYQKIIHSNTSVGVISFNEFDNFETSTSV